MAHKLLDIDFTSVTPDSWEGFPNSENLKREIGRTVLAHSEIADEIWGCISRLTRLETSTLLLRHSKEKGSDHF